MRRICLDFHEGTLDNIDADAVMSFVDNWSPAKPEAPINADDCNVLWEDQITGNKYHLHGPCRFFFLCPAPRSHVARRCGHDIQVRMVDVCGATPGGAVETTGLYGNSNNGHEENENKTRPANVVTKKNILYGVPTMMM